MMKYQGMVRRDIQYIYSDIQMFHVRIIFLLGLIKAGLKVKSCRIKVNARFHVLVIECVLPLRPLQYTYAVAAA